MFGRPANECSWCSPESRERLEGGVMMVLVGTKAGVETWRCPRCGACMVRAAGHQESRLLGHGIEFGEYTWDSGYCETCSYTEY